MAIIDTLNTNQIANLLMQDDNAKWTYEGAKALAEYYEQLSEDLGENIEFNPIAIRCEWSEFDEGALLDAYGYMLDGEEFKEDEKLNRLVEVLEYETTVIELTSTWLVQEF